MAKLFSRRGFVKVGAGLLAFLPAAKYLANLPEANAKVIPNWYVNCSSQRCVYGGADCEEVGCNYVVVHYYFCYDTYQENFCEVVRIDTGVPC